MYIYCRAAALVTTCLVVGVTGCAVSFPDYGLASEGGGGASNAGAAGVGGEGGVGGAGGLLGGSGNEDCFNGIDDDDDGDADCEDVGDCGHHLSVPTAPVGWEGPVAITPNGGTSCDEDWPDEITGTREANYDAKPASCPCSCGSPSAAYACPTMDFTFWAGNACASEPRNFVRPNGACVSSVSPPMTGVASVSGAANAPVGGSCAPVGETEIEEPQLEVRALCGASTLGAGKTADDVCVPIPKEAFEQRVCIYAEGEQECPTSAVYTEQYVLFSTHLDTRDCDVACSCGSPSGGSCTGFVHIYQSGNCSGAGTNLPANGGCQAFSGLVPSFGVTIDPPTGGSCAPAVRSAIGTVTGQRPTTACCSLPVTTQ